MLAEAGEEKDLINRVIASAYIRAIIRANDALCWCFLGEVPDDHGDASGYFRRLYEQNHVDEKYSRCTSSISDVLSYKNAVEYKGEDLSKRKFSKLKKQVNRFIENAVKDMLEEEDFQA